MVQVTANAGTGITSPALPISTNQAHCAVSGLAGYQAVPEDDGAGDRSHDGCKDRDAPEGFGVAPCQAGLGVAQGELAAQEPHRPGAARPFGDSAFRKPVRMSLKKSAFSMWGQWPHSGTV